MDRTRIQDIVDWLADGARTEVTSEDVLAELCRRLIACGFPLWRAVVFVRTLHPQLIGRRFIWQQEKGVTSIASPFETLESEEYRVSPIARVHRTGAAVRRRLLDPECPRDFPILEEFRAEGITDYMIHPLIFTDGAVHAVALTTRRETGFAEADIEGIQRLLPTFARVAEIRALRRTATNLLDTYVGREAGEQILAGRIRRGDIETIHAAIWLSDMRSFTARSDRLPPADLLALLNRYFDCQVPAILEHGGEVLKFMGDGLLAIFPVAGGEAEAARVCAQALAAARETEKLVDALGFRSALGHIASLKFGLALHIGSVMYGNVGGGNRLDFTCIGPAVNLAARLEKLASRLGRTIVASEAFARLCGPGLVPLGPFELAGFSEPQAAYGLAEDGSATSPR